MFGSLPPKVHAFLLEKIDSLEELEILLLLRREPREWTPAEVSREIRIQPEAAANRLGILTGRSLLREASPARFIYARTPDLEVDLAALAAAYGQQRLTVINFIATKHLERIKSFAKAFKLKGDGK